MAGNSNLHDSIRNKQDEFYTQLSMIENELKHYIHHFKDKVVLCNCDDPFESNFFKYFALNFKFLGLKKLIATGYNTSPILGKELNVWTGEETDFPVKTPYVAYINDVSDLNNDGRIDLEDVKILLTSKHNCKRKLKGDSNYPAGDFRSEECLKLLRQADIVVTNPPFSLFREYLAQLIELKKKFLIIGRISATTYKEVFPYFENNKIWLGKNSGHFWFKVPDSYETKKTDFKIDETGQKWRRMGNICWFTNLDFEIHHENMILYKKYNKKDYPKYDNYDAINIDNVKDIPCDYDGIMGVPVTFFAKYCPEQFEILGCTQRGCHDLVPDIKKYNDYWEVRQDGSKTGSSGNKTNENPNLAINDGKHNYFTNKDGHIVQSTFGRIFIKRR